VIGVLGGLLAALMWGGSTAVASRSTRMIGSQQVLAWVMLTGFGIMAVVAPVVEGRPDMTAHGLAWALLGGAAAVGGLGLVYAALRIGKVGVVAPIASTEGALAAVFAVVLLGQRPTVLVVVALAVIAAGVVVVTFHGEIADLRLRPALMAGAAASVFGIGLVATSQAGRVLGPYWTILIARVVGMAVVVAPMVLARRLARPGAAVWLVAFSGIAEVVGFVGYVVGARHGVAVPAVLGSQFAAVAAVISYFAFGERLSRTQVSGVVAIAAGVAWVAVLRA
jgi:transporter family protein